MNNGEIKKWYLAFRKKRAWLLLLVPISLIMLWVVQKNEEIAEHIFARGIYKYLSQGLSRFTGIFPFSLMEVEIIILPVLALIYIVYFIWKLVKLKQNKQNSIGYFITKEFINVGCFLSVVLFLYMLFAGVNYNRYTFADYSGLEIKESSVKELYNLNKHLATEAVKLRTELQEVKEQDANSSITIENSSWTDLTKEANAAFDNLSKQYPVLGGNYGTPKPVHFSRVMSSMEITGIFWPFTLEANVNVDVPEYTIPATMLHELAHLRGYMREDEANFIAYLASQQSDNPAIKYSGVMLALTYVSNQLYLQDQELYDNITKLYNTGMIADLRENYYYWQPFEDTAISTISSNMNDSYLKANSQKDGVKSYGRMVDLLLADYRSKLK